MLKIFEFIEKIMSISICRLINIPNDHQVKIRKTITGKNNVLITD